MKKVLVLLATYNGAKYLEEQIDSILKQKNIDIDILACDDFSNDETFGILKKYEKQNKLKCYQKKCGSASKNFYNLINEAPDNYDYYALSDQDDYWFTDKIASAIKKIEQKDLSNPCLYSGISTLVDKNLKPIKKRKYKHHLVDTLESALIASNVQGCTIVFNKQLLIKIKNKNTKTTIMHDSWLHKTCLLLNGNVVFDDKSYMYYRQHENNVFASLGKKNSIIHKLKEKCNIIFGKNNYYQITNIIKEWKENFKEEISSEKLIFLDEILNSNKSIKNKLKIITSKKYYSKYKINYIKFIYLILIGKI